MATRKKSGSPKDVEPPKPEPDSGSMEQRMVAFAEQLGRIAGTVGRKTTGWMDREALSEQLTRVRDGAADLLSVLGGASKPEPPPAPDPRVRSREKVAAPGKKHRKPMVSPPVRHSDERIPKSRAASAARRIRRKG